jgi:hypothetical protein
MRLKLMRGAITKNGLNGIEARFGVAIQSLPAQYLIAGSENRHRMGLDGLRTSPDRLIRLTVTIVQIR